MSMLEIIYKKRDGGILTEKDIQYWIHGCVTGEIPDYQISALLMAIYFKGLSRQETFFLTEAMKQSGDIINLSGIKGIKVDKHSSGGVGDKTTLITAPLAAACGVPVAKMSGRGLGFSGGTIDKLEAIPGFKATATEEQFTDQINRIGLAIIGQTKNIAIADKILYSLRDVTGTVENISLIASSIMSKKLASGSDAIVLDVKWGKGAFMHDPYEAAKLGKLMVDIGKKAGKEMVALITNMNQPLGRAIGNGLEVKEAIDVLKGEGTDDIKELSLRLAAYMIYCGKKAKTPESGYVIAKEALESGKGLEKFKEFIDAQGGDVNVINNSELLIQSEKIHKIRAFSTGYIVSIDGGVVGRASQISGAGRETKDDVINHSAGILLYKKIGDRVKEGDVIATIHGCECLLPDAAKILEKAYEVGAEKPEETPLIFDIIM